MSRWSISSARMRKQVSSIPARHQQRHKLSRAACHNYTFTYWSSSHLFPQISQASSTLSRPPPQSLPPHQPTPKNLYGKTQMKTDFPSQQNCDKSGTVWWSTWSSARHWWVREWRLTLNESTGSNRKPTLTIRDILLNWLVPFAREPLLGSREPTW